MGLRARTLLKNELTFIEQVSAKLSAKYFICTILIDLIIKGNHKISTIIIYILEMKLWHGEFKYLYQVHIAGKWGS